MIKATLKAVWGTLVALGGMVFLVAVAAFVLNVCKAHAHSGTPAMVTFQAGARLTAADLNNALAHIHNTLSGGLADANISATAAIAHTKLATPALIAKASGIVTANCDSTAAAGTDCTFTSISNVTAISSQGGAGIYCVDLAYAPANTTFVVQVTSHSATHTCIATDRNTGAACGGDTYNFYVRCYDAALALSNNAQFSFVVFDDNNP